MAVDQQQAAAARIVGQMQKAAHGTSQASNATELVGQSSGLTGEAADKVQAEAGELSRHAEGLRRQVRDFLSAIRAA